MPRQYKNLKEIAQYLRLSESTIRRLYKRFDDPLPHRKIGGTYLFDVEKVDRWHDRQPGRDGEDIAI